MRKFLLLLSFVLSSSVFASAFKLDATVAYTRNFDSNNNGYLVSPGAYLVLLDPAGFNLAVGIEAVHYSYKGFEWTQSYSIIPAARLQVLAFTFKFGFGYDWNTDDDSSPITFVGASFLPSLGAFRLGIDLRSAYRISNSSAKTFSVGPMLSFNF